MAREIQVPDFQFSAFYYQEILDALINYRRVNVPEITDENEFEPYVQLERAFALVGHLNNVLLDFAAKESLLPTATLRSSVKNILKLIGFELLEATPSTVDLLIELSKVFNASSTLVPDESQFGTLATPTADSVVFENLDDFDISRTDRATAVFAEESTVFTNYTTESYTPASFFTPWTTPAPGDKLYIGHAEILWDRIRVVLDSFASGLDGTWEYFDGSTDDVEPDAVVDLGTQLEFDITALLGTQDRHGAIVRITLNSTGAFEEVASEWDGGKNIAVVGLLGQTTPSLNTIDYAVGTEWHPLADLDAVIDGTANFTQDGNVDYDVPQTLLKVWNKTIINSVSAYWVRYRIVNVTAPTAPDIDLLDIADRKQFAVVPATQGTTIPQEVLGSSTGQADQTFTTLLSGVIQNSIDVFVDAEEWIEVENFLNSDATDKHYTFETDDDGFGIVDFGNGITGKIPPIGVDNITADYRVGADQDGNVGRDTVTVNRSGVAFLNRINNPRPAVGWKARRGETEEDIELLKIEGPASVRTLERAVAVQDIEDLAVAFVSSGGSQPVSRALAIEEGFGVKTVDLVLVGTGGALISSGLKQEIEDYFNGNETAGIDGVGMANHRVFTSDYQPRTIDVIVTVFGGTLNEIENALTALLDPEAKTADGLRFEWEFGEEVPRSRLISEIFTVIGVRKVTMTIPAGDTALSPKELPTVGMLTITVEP